MKITMNLLNTSPDNDQCSQDWNKLANFYLKSHDKEITIQNDKGFYDIKDIIRF